MKYRLDDIFDLQMGKTPSRNNLEYWETQDNKWISIGDLSQSGKYISKTKEYLSNEAVRQSGIKIIPAGTVIMSFKLSIGKTAITQEDMYSNEAIMAFHDKKVVEMLPEYIYYLFKCKDWDKGTNKAVMGKTLNKATLSQIQVDICSIEEQHRIVKNLNDVSEFIDNIKMLQDDLDMLIKSRFVEMFGDLESPSCHWERIKLVEACVKSDDIKCGPFGTQLNKDEYVDEGVAVWEIPQINTAFKTSPTHFVTENKAEQLKAYSLIPGDIAMSRKGNVGKCALFPEGYDIGIIHSDVLRIRVDFEKVNPVFMMRQLHYSGAVKHQIDLVSSGAIMAGINVTKLKEIFVHIPPIELQNQFADFVSSVDKLKVELQKTMNETQILFDSLMQKYFG